MVHYDLSKNNTLIDEHYVGLKDVILDKIDKSVIKIPLKNFLKINLLTILTSQPKEIYILSNKFNRLNAPKDKIKIKQINAIFNYASFIIKDKYKYCAYKLAEKLGIRTCLYCNRNYTLTVIDNEVDDVKKRFITRPEFDHFFDKNTHPILALSIYNLVPSCKICNSGLKGKIHFKLKDNFHPYIDNYINDYEYKYEPSSYESIVGGSSEVELTLTSLTADKNISTKIHKHAKIFKLNEIMTMHSDEFKDLFEIRNKYSERYLDIICATYSHLGLSHSEAYKMAFGVFIEEGKFNVRPFSKIKNDLLKQLDLI